MDELKSKNTLNLCWGQLWPEAVKADEGTPDTGDDVQRIVALARRIGGEGFDDMEDVDVEELLASHSAELTDEDLEELVRSDDDPNGDDDNEEEHSASKITLSGINEIFLDMKRLCDKVVDLDPFMERSIKVKHLLEDALAPYREVRNDLLKAQKQTSIRRFMHPTSPRKDEPQPSTSGITTSRSPTSETEEEEFLLASPSSTSSSSS